MHAQLGLQSTNFPYVKAPKYIFIGLIPFWVTWGYQCRLLLEPSVPIHNFTVHPVYSLSERFCMGASV